ncbi:MFS transporter [Sphingobium sp. V4]|uniref:MFS transporter n=1 Tax=Sphingobium sp. V4 TaxID=3038927 RepID=UPI00255822D0|nr:MFS transporter [Sphingobium sp. V4]WIW89412.1 MFS transporter [Sphingobium sp. V4]
MSLQATFSPLRHRAYRWLWIAVMSSSFGNIVQIMAASWMMLDMGSSVMVPFVQTAANLPAVAFGLLAGALTDSMGRRKLILVSQIFALTVAMLLLLAVTRGAVDPFVLLAFTFLLGAANVLFLPAWQTSIHELLPKEDLAAAVGLNAIIVNAARCVAPALGGMLMAIGGVRAAFLFNALSYFLLAVVLIAHPWNSPATAGSPLLRSIKEGLRYVGSDRSLVSIVAHAFVFSFNVSVYMSFLPLISRSLLGTNLDSYALALSLFGSGSVLGGLLGTRLRGVFSGALLLAGCMGAMALCTVPLSFHAIPPIIYGALFVAGFGWVLALSTLNYTLQMASLAQFVGRALSIYHLATFSGLALGSALWAWVATWIGLELTLSLSGAALIVAAFALRRSVGAIPSVAQ